MSLLPEFKAMLDERRQHLAALDERIATNADTIERLMAQNAADAAAKGDLANEIEFLERQVVQLGEHEPVAEPVKPTASESRREAEEIVRARHDAEQANKRRQKSKPDATKAAKKAAKAAATEPTTVKKAHSHFSRDPLAVKPKGNTSGRKSPTNRAPVTDVLDGKLDLSAVSPTKLARAELVYEIIAERSGKITQRQVGEDLSVLMECDEASAQPIASQSLAVLAAQKRIVATGEKIGRSRVLRITTPDERAAAGLGVDENNYAGTTTRPPDARATKTRITVESSQFEGGR